MDRDSAKASCCDEDDDKETVRSKDSLDESSDLADLLEEALGGDSPGAPAVEGEAEEAHDDSPLPLDGDMKATADPPIQASTSLSEWILEVQAAFRGETTFSKLGGDVLRLISRAPTPLGRFFREWCIPTRPPPGAVPPHQRRGDILPVPIWLIETQLVEVDEDVVVWVQAVFSVLNFNYCAGWSRPVCVPVDSKLSENQRVAIDSVARVVKANVVGPDSIGDKEEAKGFMDSNWRVTGGSPLAPLEDLCVDLVSPVWPRPGEAGILEVTNFLAEGTRQAMEDPYVSLLPPDMMPEKAPHAEVHASDASWRSICALGHQRGLMKIVSDDLVPRDRMGHLITIVGRLESDWRRTSSNSFASFLL